MAASTPAPSATDGAAERLFAPQKQQDSAQSFDGKLPPWKVLVVDDDDDVHVITRMVLKTVIYRSRGLELLDAYSADEAQKILAANPDIALILLDVVMETPDAGLQLVRTIREELSMELVRIIIRTGQPGFAPETEVMQQYDINDYQNKTELTLNRLKTIIIAGIRAFDAIFSVDTLRRNLEQVVKERTHDLEESNAIKDTMFSIIAHDLRGPIGNVKAFLDLLLKQRNGEESGDRLEYMQILQSNASATLSLLDNLLFWARSNQQLIEPLIKPADLRPIILDVIGLMSGQAWTKGITIEFERIAPMVCNFDANMVAVIFRNLLSNAIKYTYDHGLIRIVVTETVETFQIAVHDNGLGIDPSRIPDLYAEQLKSSTFGTRSEKGSGLGLLLSVQFLRMMGSRLTIASELGKGSVFSFELNRASA